ncbi:hypothetical protein L1987_43166 [Smallanthus sonchifolius]|uniref:Uncharacterized protein n=1 Tax=Smallanthus sonchifolius TaxID=185202 RepID=A0ACB9GKC1_9ASTR|nr:hypothetical protein L1987_43166 [Smallanthus sonchifolius]
MRAALLWTINDFPAYGYLSGWSTSGYKACPLGKRDRNDDKTSSDARSFELDIFRLNGRGIGKKEVYILPSFLMNKAKWFIFNNCEEVQPYLEEHLQFLQRQHPE